MYLDKKYERCKEGDLIILFGGYETILQVKLEANKRVQTKSGVFLHNDIIGSIYGSRVWDISKCKWMAILKLSPEFISQSLRYRTQIIYQADISLIIVLLDTSPGKRIIEAGTGSASLTVSLARSTAPNGTIFTFEYDKERYEEAVKDFEKYQICNVVCEHRDVCSFGFKNQNIHDHSADAVFLDLPSPWNAICNADEVLVKGGRIVIFSPCIEQVMKNCAELNKLKYIQIRTFEVLYKPWGIVRGILKKFPNQGLRYQLPTRGHTGYLTLAIKPVI
ncbi:tRNA methyltransferase catalytic subunit [Cryptosporidium andersoni]|uniref:tRNA (adenine(58)-N(1))-methyltransferase n=1 Tax=Cryptosporidium andersoni TaxID=117008 RepID=A0A1J4MZ96_9CRYT|nr:tRNA methyltransferase catalytic subunit [Cryptosporidium andersoni]